MQIQMIKYGLNDTKRMKKKHALLIYTLWYEFSNDFDAQKIYSLGPFLS